MKGVNVQRFVDLFQMKNLTTEIDLSIREITVSEINRPALQFCGYFEHFPKERVQIVGMVEYAYLQQLDDERRTAAIEAFFSYDIPCIVFCRGLIPEGNFLDIAKKHNVAVLSTERKTSSITAEIIRVLNEELAPCISIHGVLVDVYGEGLLIMGESGIGKSETALELIRRGHRLVTDDVVEIRKINERTLIGTSPDITRYFIELRGIGIIDVKALYGVECVKEKQNIDLVIKLEDWKKDNEYDRMGLEQEYTEFLGTKVVCHSLPIRPGRNLALICEAAAVNHRQKKMGYNAAKELCRRVQENLSKDNSEEK